MDWQPIETAPRDGTRVLLLSDDKRTWPVKIGTHFDDVGWLSDDGDEEHWPRPWQPTHWMPLPQPPKETA